MAIPLKNVIHDKIKSAGSITDADLYKSITKDGVLVAADRFNKILMDLEIMGLVNVAWITKEERRIEVIESGDPTQDRPSENGKMHAAEKDYEASFPGLEKS